MKKVLLLAFITMLVTACNQETVQTTAALQQCQNVDTRILELNTIAEQQSATFVDERGKYKLLQLPHSPYHVTLQFYFNDTTVVKATNEKGQYIKVIDTCSDLNIDYAERFSGQVMVDIFNPLNSVPVDVSARAEYIEFYDQALNAAIEVFRK